VESRLRVVLLTCVILAIIGIIVVLLGACPTEEAVSLRLVVAAADSSDQAKADADYRCDGVDDHREIQAALDALPSGGGTVLLAEGTFNCAGNIYPGINATLQGHGEDKTVLDFPGTGGIRVRSPHVVLDGFTVLGTADILIEASHVRVRNIVMTVDNSRIGAFYVWASSRVVEDIEFVNCRAVDCGRYGFLNSGEGDTRLIRNIRYFDCEAINCGKDSHVSTGPWVTGFDLAEKNDLEDCLVENCRAEGNQESGFHLEGFSYLDIVNVTFKNCVSVNNAAKGRDACTFGAGYTLTKGATLENCFSSNNKNGFLINTGTTAKGADVIFRECIDKRSDYGFVVTNGNNYNLIDCQSTGACIGSLLIDSSDEVVVRNFRSIPAEGESTCTATTDSGQSAAALIRDSRDVTVSGTIRTEHPYPVLITGERTGEILLTDLAVISEGTDQTSRGILIAKSVAKAGSILIRDSSITDPKDLPTLASGIANLAREKVRVENVSVVGAVTPYINCDIVRETPATSPTPQPGFTVASVVAGLAVVVIALRRRR